MGQRLGSLIGAIGGLAFFLINAGALPGAAPTVVRVLGVVAFLAVACYAVVRTRKRPQGPRPSRSALRTYWLCVVGEVAAFPIGALVLTRVLHRPELTPVWVVMVVGVHFLPFARAFGVPLFLRLGVALVVVAVLGAVVALALGPAAAPAVAGATGVVAGVFLLVFAALGARSPAYSPTRPSMRSRSRSA